MAQVQASVAIDAPGALVFGLIRDQAQRERFLPHDWHVRRLLTDQHDAVGAMMELETRIGPGPMLQVVRLQAIEVGTVAGPAERLLVESPPTADNYITTWTVRGDDRSTVSLHMEFSYGDLIGDFLARRRLKKAYSEMLQRLKAVAEDEAARRRPSD